MPTYHPNAIQIQSAVFPQSTGQRPTDRWSRTPGDKTCTINHLRSINDSDAANNINPTVYGAVILATAIARVHLV